MGVVGLCRDSSLEQFQSSLSKKCRMQKGRTQNIQEIQNSMRRPNLRIIAIEELEDPQHKGPVNINKIIEENFPNLKKEMPINIKEGYRTPNRLDQKRNSSLHITVRTPNAQNKERILNTARERGQVRHKGRAIRVTPDFRDYECQKILGRFHTDPKRTQMPAQATIPTKTLNYHRWRNEDGP